MADAVLSFVLDQLSTFVRDESALLGGLRDEVEDIKTELEQMKGFLRRADAIVENYRYLEAWVSQVRDVAYDVEDVLDEFSHYDDRFLGRIQNLKARHQLAKKIHTIKKRIKNISEAHQRYTNQLGIFDVRNDVQNQNQTTGYDSRGDVLLVEEADLVGIERPKKQLMNMLLTSDSQLRVVSVIGMGGLGKTTLVRKVYDDPNVKKRFKHHAWITVSQSFKIETLLKHVIEQLREELNQPAPDELDRMGTKKMKKLVRDLLQENYILVFDDIWKTTDWDAIQMTFPRNSCGSCIMITSRNVDIGRAAMSAFDGDIYHLKPLTEEESRTLFCKKAFRGTSCPDRLKNISKNIIDRCGGLPLAIVVIAGVLARKSRRTKEWDLFNRSLGEQLAGNDQLRNMAKIISLSYYNLPDNLKNCFLYLSILPEDASIKTGRLIRLWIAEGFVQKKGGMTIEEVAESYLIDLINRSLVQVDKTARDGRLKACRVHDVIHQIILRKAREQGVTSIVSEQEMEFSAKVRRLVIHSPSANPEVSNGLLKCVRSLVSLESMSRSFQSKLVSNGLRLLKVLDLEGAVLEAIPNEIFKMFRLKCLSLRKTKVKIVPKLIGKLQNLETLDLKHTMVRKLPLEILKCRQLRHLLIGKGKINGVEAPCKIGTLQSLQSLGKINANEMGTVKEIGKLTQLRKLGITKLRREDGKDLCSTLGKLTNLQSLFVSSTKGGEDVIDLQCSFPSTPQFLRTLKLYGRLEKVPQWIQSLQELTSIDLCLSRLTDDPLQLLQDLPNLVDLWLYRAYEGEGLRFKAGRFQGLKRLGIGLMPKLRRVRVEKGAMPALEYLRIEECESMEELPVGVEHLITLKSLEFTNMPDKFVKSLEDMVTKKNKKNKKKRLLTSLEFLYQLGLMVNINCTTSCEEGRRWPSEGEMQAVVEKNEDTIWTLSLLFCIHFHFASFFFFFCHMFVVFSLCSSSVFQFRIDFQLYRSVCFY